MITAKNKSIVAAISELRNKSEKILKTLKDHQVILERRKKPVAVMLDYAQFKKFNAMIELAEDYILGSLALARDKKAQEGDFTDLKRW